MDYYLMLKWFHIIAAIIVTGTGAGIAFFMLMAYRSGNWQAIAVTARHVVLADWLFTTPSIVVQIVTGVLLMSHLGWAFNSQWFIAVLVLYAVVAFSWLTVVKIQYQLRKLSAEVIAGRSTDDTESSFKSLMRGWTLLGVVAFTTILVIVGLMVFKPLPLT
ncbi:DUF2269 domain-containing protein [Porticoccaceae bacterium LTM1]|nr:DUF2269 domain-containing protein [Porticoccaceae bacterium LTM1]